MISLVIQQHKNRFPFRIKNSFVFSKKKKSNELMYEIYVFNPNWIVDIPIKTIS